MGPSTARVWLKKNEQSGGADQIEIAKDKSVMSRSGKISYDV